MEHSGKTENQDLNFCNEGFWMNIAQIGKNPDFLTFFVKNPEFSLLVFQKNSWGPMGPLAPIPPSGYSCGVAPPGHITLVLYLSMHLRSLAIIAGQLDGAAPVRH